MMKKTSSILDYSMPSLDPAVFGPDGKLFAYQKDFIIRLLNTMYETYGLKQPELWVEDVVILGSLTTSKWLFVSDCDVHIRVNLDAFIASNMTGSTQEQAFEYLDTTRKEFDRAKIVLPMTQHPVEFYFESLIPSNVELVGVYSLLQDRWIKEPVLFPADLDFEESKKAVVAEAEALAEELDGSLGKVKRDIQRVNELEIAIQAWGKDKQQLFYNKIEQKLKDIETEILKDVQIKQDLVDERHEKQDPTSDNEILFKYLARNGYFSILQNLKTLLKQTGGEITTTELPLVKKIINESSLKEAFLKEALEKEKEMDICVDLDRTIAKPAKFPEIGEPIDGAKEALTKLQELGYNVIIYSCRADTEEGLDLIKEYLDKYDLPYDSIFEGVKPIAQFYIDDHAIEFKGNWDNVIKQVEKSEKKASLHITSSDGQFGGYWIQPNGNVIDIGENEHWKWVDEQGLPDNLISTKGWVRVREIPDRIFIQLNDIRNIPDYLNDFLISHPNNVVTVADGHNKNVTVDYDDAINMGLQKAINKELTIGITAKLNQKYWLDPSGKEFSIGKQSHGSWINPNRELLKSYGIDISELLIADKEDPLIGQTYDAAVFDIANAMIRDGWTRVTTESDYDFAMEVADINNLPSYLDNFIAQHYTGGGVEIDDLEGNYQDISDPFPSLRKAIYQAKRLRQQPVAKLFSKKEITAQTKKVKQGDYSCVMALVPHELAQEIVEFGVRTIPDEDLYLDEDGKLGRELESHITIKYGLLTNDAKEVRRSFNDEKPFKAKLGKVRHFEPPELPFDVLTVEVISTDLEKVNKKICDMFECAEDLVSNDYKPHITIAYMKRGKAKDYVGSDEFEGKEIELDTVIFSPHKGNRTYFSISNDKESAYILEQVKTASGNNFLPSLCEQPANNEWQFQHGGDDVEIALDPDPVSDETTWYAPCTEGKPRSKEVWRQFISMFKNPFSKKEEMTVDSAYDPELDEKEKEEMGLDQTQLEYSKGFYDPKKHDFPHNTQWFQDYQGVQEPDKVTPVTYSPQMNPAFDRQNSPGGYPNRFCRKPESEWFSDEGEIVPALENMWKYREAALDNITKDITKTAITRQYALYIGGRLAIRTLTRSKALKICQERFPKQFAAGDYEIKEEAYIVAKQASWEGGWIDPKGKFYNTGTHEEFIKGNPKLFGLTEDDIFNLDDEGLFNAAYSAGWVRVRMFDGNLLYIQADNIRQAELATDFIFENINNAKKIEVYLEQEGSGYIASPREFKENGWDSLHKIANKKTSGVQSASVPDYQMDEWKSDQIHDDTDEAPYINHDERDYPNGMWDAPQNTSNAFPWAKDITPYVVRLDLLQDPALRENPFDMTEYWVTYYNSMPMSDSIEQGNPE